MHVHAAVIDLEVAVFDAQNFELGLRLSLLFSNCALDVSHSLHRVANLARQNFILLLHLT